MGDCISVPPGEKGDGVLLKLIPNLHKIAKRKQNKNRTDTS